jgi:G3E family GTPase
VAVLVNDFGSVNIDAELIVGIEDNVVSLANGCTCCSLRDDLVASVIDTINRPERPELIVLEASGVADPGGITMAFTTPRLAEAIRLDSVTCVVDADSVFDHPEYPEVNQLKLMQIAFSDMVVLNKVSLAGPEKVAAVHQWIDDRFDNIRVFETDFADVPPEILLSVGRLEPAAVAGPSHLADPEQHAHPAQHADLDHHAQFDTWTFHSNQALSLPLLEDAMRRLPGTVFRCKGIVRDVAEPERPAVLQVVCRRVDITSGDVWHGAPATRVVVIGACGLPADELQRLFESCAPG